MGSISNLSDSLGARQDNDAISSLHLCRWRICANPDGSIYDQKQKRRGQN